MRKLSLCTLAICLGFASVTHADPTVTRYKFKGNTVSGTATSRAADECFVTTLTLQASDEVTKDASGTATAKKLLLTFSGTDYCTFHGWASFKELPLTINLAGQTNVTIPFDTTVDYVDTETGLRVQKRLTGSATFTATGDFTKSRRTETQETSLLRKVSRTKGTTREATLVVDAKLDGLQQTFQTSTGEIGTVKTGNLEITLY